MFVDPWTTGGTLTNDWGSLGNQAEHLNNVPGIRMILSLIHQGSIRIPKNEEIPDKGELFEQEEESDPSEISRFESMLHTYLDVPPDTLRRAFDKHGQDAPFGLRKDHVECLDHGFHEYWIVETLPDRNYLFREDFSDLAKTLLESEGPIWREAHPN